MTNKLKLIVGILFLGAAILVSQSASAIETRLICIFDPVGNSGDMTSLIKDFKLRSLDWGVDLKLRSYTHESVIIDKFKAGQCDGALLTGIKSRIFNRFSSTIEALGATPDEDIFRTALQVILNLKPKTAHKFLRNGPYEVVGVIPVGAMYNFVRDRKWDSLDKVQGKRIAVLEGDAVSQSLVRRAGGTPVIVTTTNFAGKFNNGSVDIVTAPAAAYEPLEMYRGLGKDGGVIDLPVGQLTFQFLIHHDKFPANFGSKARQSFSDNLDGFFEFIIHRALKTIDPKYWVRINPKDKPAYAAVMRQARIMLRDEGVYDGTMLKILRKIRCKKDPRAAECSETLE